MLEKRDVDACVDVFKCASPGLSAALSGRGRLLDYATGADLPNRAPYSAVVILAGTNDLADDGVSAAAVFSRLQRLHEACYAAGVLRTVAIGVPESVYGSRNRRHDAVRCEVNSLLAAWAAAPERRGCCMYLPCPAGLQDLCPDGLHFTPSGYEVLGEGVARAAGAFLLRGTLTAFEA
jgi:lysophospholipase L1-like esterase